jgi:hypothetical protein
MAPHWKDSGDLPPANELARVTMLLTNLLDAEKLTAPQQVFILANALACSAVALVSIDIDASECRRIARTLLETRLQAAERAAKAAVR